MKRYIAITFAILTISLSTVAQKVTEYKVVRVVGTVENPAARKTVKTGDVISSDSKLTFGSKDSYIIVAGPDIGRKRISGIPDSKPRELLELFKYFVQPEVRSAASRGLSREYLDSLQGSLKCDTLLILPPAYLGINTKKLSLAKPAVIRAWYSRNKKIQYVKISDQSGLRLDRQSIFGDNPPAPHPRIVLEYFEDETKDPVFSGPGLMIASFVPMYPADEASLAAEVRALLSSLAANAKYSEKLMEVRAYLEAEYAIAHEDNVKQWLKRQGILSE